MGKMGEAASLGAVAIAAFIVYKLAGLKLPTLELPKLPDLSIVPGPIIPEIPAISSYGPQGGLSGLNGVTGRDNGNGMGDPNDSDTVETVYVPVIIETIREPLPTPAPIVTLGPGVGSILEGMIARKPGFYAQVEEGFLDAGGGVNV